MINSVSLTAILQKIYNRLTVIAKDFGNEKIAKLLYEQARCEELFGTVNVLNGQTMEPLDSQEFMPEQKRAAIINARDIEKQILALVRLFSKKENKDKLMSIFGYVYRGSNNEIE